MFFLLDLWSRLRRRRGKSAAAELPLLRPQTVLSGFLATQKSPLQTYKVTVSELGRQRLVCRSQQLWEEGERVHLELFHARVGTVPVKARIDWVDVCHFGHSVGLTLLSCAREYEYYLAEVEREERVLQARGKALRPE